MSFELAHSPAYLREEFLALETPDNVASLLEVEYQDLIYYLYRLPPEQRYTTFSINKRSGKMREISTPHPSLKIIQQKLNQVFESVYQPKKSVHGFVKARNIVTNAKGHLRKRYVLNVDLENFFPSINFGRVRGMLMNIPYNLPDKVATILAQICCFNGVLPQGAPTSPIVSNMICAKMDSQLLQLAKKNGCYYTRYADDITFSTNLDEFPHDLAIRVDGKLEVGRTLHGIISQNRFNLNLSKVRLQTANARQEVTGLTVNHRLNVQRKYISQIRAMLYAWKQHGYEAAEREYFEKYRPKPSHYKHRSPSKAGFRFSFRDVLKGKIEFIGMVRTKNNWEYVRFLNQFRELDIGRVKAKIFISYRRDSSQAFVGRLHEKLVLRIDGDVFYDAESMRSGAFPDQIRTAIQGCNVFLSVISRGTFDRIDETDDWVRKEIELALSNENCTIIPILDDRTLLPEEYDLPESIRYLVRLQARTIYNDHFNEGIERLLQYIRDR